MKIMVLPFCLVKCCRYICKEKIQSVAYLSVLMLLAFSTLTAQNAGKVSGIIKDAETGELLIGCNVSILGTMMGSTSDIEGVFYILNVSPGKYDIQASLIGYQKVVQRGTIVNSARTTVVNFVLTSTALKQK
jgi:hypothetical protein